MTTIKNIFTGAALGTFLGSLAIFLYPRRNEILDYLMDHSGDINDLTDKAREYGQSLLSKGFRRVEYRDNYWKGGLLGIIVGVGAGMLLAPKAGKNLRGQITKAYNDLSERSEEVIHQFKNNSHNPFATSHGHHHHNGVKKKKPAVKAKKAAR